MNTGVYYARLTIAGNPTFRSLKTKLLMLPNPRWTNRQLFGDAGAFAGFVTMGIVLKLPQVQCRS